MRRRWMFIVPAAIAGIVLVMAIGGEVVRLLWNWLLPPLFGLPQIGFWQALGLLALCRILFGGTGGRGSYRSGMRRRVAERVEARMDDRCAGMTPEERQRFRQGLRDRFGFGPSPNEPGNE